MATPNLKAEVAALREAVRQLYDFAITELDPDPHAVEAYINDPAAAAAAHRAIGETEQAAVR